MSFANIIPCTQVGKPTHLALRIEKPFSSLRNVIAQLIRSAGTDADCVAVIESEDYIEVILASKSKQRSVRLSHGDWLVASPLRRVTDAEFAAEFRTLLSHAEPQSAAEPAPAEDRSWVSRVIEEMAEVREIKRLVSDNVITESAWSPLLVSALRDYADILELRLRTLGAKDASVPYDGTSPDDIHTTLRNFGARTSERLERLSRCARLQTDPALAKQKDIMASVAWLLSEPTLDSVLTPRADDTVDALRAVIESIIRR